MKKLILLATLLLRGVLPTTAATVQLGSSTNGVTVQVLGDKDDEFRYQTSDDLANWADSAVLGLTMADADPRTVGSDLLTVPARFIRAVKTAGLYDDTLVRTFRITFPSANWATQLATSRTTGINTAGDLVLDNGVTATNVGFRYKGNTSYTMGGTKKSINIELGATNGTEELMGHGTVNINNAAGDSTILRETLYFNVMRQYVACPEASFAKIHINGTYWGLYSLVEQENNTLIRKFFPSADGDRWRTPNAPAATGGTGGGPGGGGGGGGGGGFSGAGSALTYLGNTNLSTYQSNYDLKSNGTSNAWANLIHAITVLGTTPTAELRDKVEDVLAVDPWLWYVGLEIVFADDDSYWNKGADYGFYFEAESGRIHPVQHDGNEAFITSDATLSPVIGSTGTNRPVISKLLAVPELRQRYLAHVRTILEERFNPTYMTAMVNRYHALTAQAVAEDTKKSFTLAAYTNALTALKSFVTNRYVFLTNHAELRPLQPVVSAVSTPVPAPTATEVPFITATVSGNSGEGIDSVWLYWRDHGYGKFSYRQMFDDGQHGDGAAGDGVFGGATTNFPAGTKVRYYVEARSNNSAKAARFYPARAELEPLTYRVRTSLVSDSPVVISEVMASNVSTLADPQGEFDDWIELHNTSDTTVDMAGRYLSDDVDNPRKWTFPAGTAIPAGGYLLVWADEDGTATPGLHASFKLSGSGEQVLLVDADAYGNGLLDSMTFPALGAGEAWGRPASDPTVPTRLAPTPGSSNP